MRFSMLTMAEPVPFDRVHPLKGRIVRNFAVLALACAMAGAANAQFVQQGEKLVGNDWSGSVPTQQGASVALSADGNTAIVGGPGDNNAVGAAWVYLRSSGGVWAQQGAKLAGTGAIGTAEQGKSVALSADGNTAIVGGPNDNSNAGAVWVYTRSAAVWTEQGGKLSVSAVGKASQGSSVALSADGNTALVGGPGYSTSGAAWVYTRSGGVWTEQGILVGTGSAANVQQGSLVALSADGNTAIVGGASGAGGVWTFTRSAGVWTQQGAELVPPDQLQSLALSGDGKTAILGGEYDASNTGAAWVYTRSGSVWTQQGGKLVGGGEADAYAGFFGSSVSLSGDGNTALVGGYGDALSQGASWVYTRAGGVWTQQGAKLVGTPYSLSAQGRAVALSSDGQTALAGGPLDGSETGAAWVFVPLPTRAVFRNTGNVVELLTFGSLTLQPASGVWGSDPVVAAAPGGNLVVAAKDTFPHSIWVNVYDATAKAWQSWHSGGGVFNSSGPPAIAMSPSGVAYIVARDTYNSYWLTNYSSTGGFGGWTGLSGIFSTDPVIAACPDGSIYIIGRDTFTSLWSYHYIPGSGSTGWHFGGGLTQGKPSVACGTDNAAYVALRDDYQTHWIGRVVGDTWTGWSYGGGVTNNHDPQIAALGNGILAVVVQDPWGAMWQNTFLEGNGNGWQSWSLIGGVLQDFSVGTLNGQLYFAGRDATDDLYWWSQWAGYTYAGNTGKAAGPLAVAPK